MSFAQPVTIDQVNVTGGTNALSLTNVTATATGAINVSKPRFTNTTGAEVLISQGNIPLTFAATATISSNAGRVDRHPEPHRRRRHLQRADHRHRRHGRSS